MTGTPKTLAEAINNGLIHAAVEGASPDQTVTVIQTHVRDFLAQRVGAAMLDENPAVVAATRKTWDSVFSK